jgi:uncharacterized RDD family membrane protein YckC
MECPHCHSAVKPQAKHCKRCGGAIPSGQHLLDECGLSENAPTAVRSASSQGPVRNAARYRFARLGDRFIAFALDLALLFGVFAVVDAWVFMRFGIFEAAELQLTTAALLMAVALNGAILFLYGWLFEAACGATLGKILVGIRVVRTAQGGALRTCAMRNLLRIVDGFGFYLVGTAVAACSEARQRVGDLWAHTAVVEDSFGAVARVSAIVLWMATLAGAGWAVPRICSSNPVVHTRYLNQVLLRIGKTPNSAYLRVGGFTVDLHS